MTLKNYMKKTGVTKRKYVEEWLDKDLIPGVSKDTQTGEYVFPNSARSHIDRDSNQPQTQLQLGQAF